MDSSSKLLDKVTMNRIIHQAIPDLDSSIKKVIVYYIDITDEAEIQKFIKEDDSKMCIRDRRMMLPRTVSLKGSCYVSYFVRFFFAFRRYFNEQNYLSPLSITRF